MKKQILLFPLTFGLSLTGGVAIAQEGFKVVDTIAGASLKFIQSALPELARYPYSFKVAEYRITVATKDGHHVVIFEDSTTPPGSRKKPGFSVELSEDGTVIRSGFSQ